MIPILFGSETDISLLFDTTGADLFDTADKQLSAGDEAGADRTFATHGYGDLSDTISCFVEEERNGSYELELTYPIDGLHFEDISLRMIIVAKPNFTDDPQPFRIYQITKPIDGICTIYARHISYDMSGIAVSPFTASNIADALSGLTSHAMNDCPFTLTTSRSTVAPFKADTTASMRSWLGGKEGSLLDVYGGEWHFDRFTATLKNSRGTDRGVVINYGHNLTELVQNENVEETFTGCVAVYVNDGVETKGTVQYIKNNVYENVYVLDVSADYETAPTVAQLDARAQAWLTEHNTPTKNITLDFVQAEKLAERVDLCDTVTINYEDLGVSATAKCIRTKWNVLLERYDETEFGDVRDNIADTIVTTAKAVEKVPTRSQMQEAISRASNLITGNIGGYVVIHDSDGDGYPDEVLIMDKPDIDTAVKVWRWNASGLGYSSTGYDGDYGLAMTIDGEIVADFITTGTLDASEVEVENINANNITVGTLSAALIAAHSIGVSKLTGSIENGNWEIDLDNGTLTIGDITANNIKGGTLTLGGNNNVSGVLQVLNASGTVIGTWDKDGIDIDAGKIEIGNNFSVDTSGNLTASNATLGSSGSGYSAKVESGQISLYYGTDFVGRLMARNGGSQGNLVRFESGPDQHAYVQLSDANGSVALRAFDGTNTTTVTVAPTDINFNSGSTIRFQNAPNFVNGLQVKGVTWSNYPVINLTTPSFNSLPKTYYSSYITADHVVAKGCGIELSNPSAQTGDWTITTAAGSITISGSINGSTTAKITLVAPTVTATATTTA